MTSDFKIDPLVDSLASSGKEATPPLPELVKVPSPDNGPEAVTEELDVQTESLTLLDNFKLNISLKVPTHRASPLPEILKGVRNIENPDQITRFNPNSKEFFESINWDEIRRANGTPSPIPSTYAPVSPFDANRTDLSLFLANKLPTNSNDFSCVELGARFLSSYTAAVRLQYSQLMNRPADGLWGVKKLENFFQMKGRFNGASEFSNALLYIMRSWATTSKIGGSISKRFSCLGEDCKRSPDIPLHELENGQCHLLNVFEMKDYTQAVCFSFLLFVKGKSRINHMWVSPSGTWPSNAAKGNNTTIDIGGINHSSVCTSVAPSRFLLGGLPWLFWSIYANALCIKQSKDGRVTLTIDAHGNLVESELTHSHLSKLTTEKIFLNESVVWGMDPYALPFGTPEFPPELFNLYPAPGGLKIRESFLTGGPSELILVAKLLSEKQNFRRYPGGGSSASTLEALRGRVADCLLTDLSLRKKIEDTILSAEIERVLPSIKERRGDSSFEFEDLARAMSEPEFKANLRFG